MRDSDATSGPSAIDLLLSAIDHQRAGRLAAAEACARQALALEPDQPTGLYLLGTFTLAAGRPEEAAALLGRGHALRPDHRDQAVAFARALLATGRAREALAVCQALADDPSFAEAHFLTGCACTALGQPTEAAAAFQRAVAIDPGHAAAWLNLGNTHVDADRLEAAEACIRTAAAKDPDLAEAHASLGHVLAAAGRPLEAVDACRRATQLRPGFAQAHWNRGVAHLLAGQYADGWDAYEWRKRHFPASFPPLPGAEWQGGALDGRTILVRAEQGFGDALQFARYLPLLRQAGGQVVLQCAGPLVRLMRRIPGIRIVERGPPPPHDVWVDQMSLPRLFGTTPDTVPAASGYLTPDPALAGTCEAALPLGLRIGLCWSGNPAHHNDRRRSMPVASLAPIVGAGARTLVSLQVGPRAGDIAKVFGIKDLSNRLTDFAETAALVAGLDLVVTVDTSVAHLAGAMGIPTWLMLAHAPDWRWMLGRDDSPWYASVRLFRQDRPGDWSGVVARVATALAGIVRPVDNFMFALPPPPSLQPAPSLAGRLSLPG